MLNLYPKFQGFKRYPNFHISLCLSTSPVHNPLAQAVTSQAEDREPLKRDFIVIMPNYLFETNGFRLNWVYLIEEKCSINDK